MLWSWGQIDSTVLDAITFSRAGHPESWLQYKEIAEIINTKSESAIYQLGGYVAEQEAALHLAASGHEVLLADVPNQEGWDFLVDGIPVQVKNTLDVSYVNEALEAHPDIPVIVPKELADNFIDHDMVFADWSLSHSEIFEQTTQTVEHFGLNH